jgi:hypothetical protein
MVKFFKNFWKVFKDLLLYYEIYIVRWLKGLTQKPGRLMKTIPPDYFSEAVFVLEKMAHEHLELRTIMNNHTSSAEFATVVHHGLGQNMRNEWKLWQKDSRLHKDIQITFSLFHADDMSSLITQCAWQRFMGMPETPFTIASGYLEYWRDMKERGEWDGKDAEEICLELKEFQKEFIKMEDKVMLAHIEHLKIENAKIKIEKIIK